VQAHFVAQNEYRHLALPLDSIEVPGGYCSAWFVII
jgi:hypothetical protein